MNDVTIGKNTFISNMCSIRGRVRIGNNCSVFDFASIRGDLGSITIGDFSNVQDSVTIHCDPGYDVNIGQYVSIGHNAVVHGCTIGNNCLIGMGAIIMNGSVIGDGTVIAAGAVILENTKIPENSMVAGIPGKIRSNSNEYRKMAHTNAEDYVQLKDTYL
ncbi:gamma carbonic anhydrase family protein [Cuniculiplasma divulgatum]|uniref:Carbonic anhydrase/acetyltransferase n=1 Tax=Cuniculiplasma divulgatum TaxID=1673428 RepID=A0A1N5VB99_9ARCH|nr:gamma carbonic anhydrase family protein [Cuniculiplasma divulgatum]SIM70421.1 carbonic anhydrase/acetyltransferase [Cuniculiplasma divulgatum]SJK85118.1 carbonic anhydrase/acetyltransferase [Cuniculiplasma divulgatum]